VIDQELQIDQEAVSPPCDARGNALEGAQ
jgi:hypothetical protein